MSSNQFHEQTPLIVTVQVAPPRQRYPHQALRRFCTIALTSSLLGLFIVFLLSVLGVPLDGRLNPPFGHHHGSSLSDAELRKLLLDTPTGEQAREWSRYFTSGPHLAGKNYSQALWTQQRWREFGFDTQIVPYECYLNYPLGHRLALFEKNTSDKSKEAWHVDYEASLEEDIIPDDETTALPDRIPTFHGYSASGNVTASYVYVNYGSHRDFEDLVNANVTLEGHIALARYGGGIFRGIKVQRAQELGMLGVVLFTDPGSDGDFTEANGHKPYPAGKARNPSSVQRGSVQYLSLGAGDPTTPGYASKPGVPRQPAERNIPSIPSLPLSYSDAIPFLRALNGHGLAASDLGDAWTAQLGLEFKHVNYNVGPSPSNLKLHLSNDQQYVTTPIWNVIGIINGTSPDEVVVLGNHRDAWIAGGAGDPHSGTAALMEVARSFGKALAKGWKPRRTIILASWDGEEYGLLGSTEWVEEYLPWLSDVSVAYVNIDCGVLGRNIWSATHPLLHQLFERVTKLVTDPGHPEQTLFDTWNGEHRVLASGSDFTAFQDFAGIPSMDIGLGDNPSEIHPRYNVTYHYHSNYDSFHFMDTFLDPGFHYHAALAKATSLVIADLAMSVATPFNATRYALELKKYILQAEQRLDLRSSVPSHSALARALRDMHHAADHFRRVAIQHDKDAAHTAAMLNSRSEPSTERLSAWRRTSTTLLQNKMQRLNHRYKLLDRHFLYGAGQDGRPWFKHVNYAPGRWTGYTGPPFPSLNEAIDSQEWRRVMKWAHIITTKINAAARSLK